jgi:prephenate dehydrogenase
MQDHPVPIERRPARGSEPLFRRIGIVGLGRIGGSVALAVRRAWPSTLLVGVDDNAVLEQASMQHAVDVGAKSLAVLADVELIVLATGYQATSSILEQLPDYVDGEAIVTDTAPVKRTLSALGARLPERLVFVGGHPIGADATGDLGSATPDLFAGTDWAVIADSNEESQLKRAATGSVSRFVEVLGARPRFLTAAQHDGMMAFLHHLPRLAAIALMRASAEGAGETAMTMGSRRLLDSTSVLGEVSSDWLLACAVGADEVGRAVDRFIELLREVRGALGSTVSLERLLADARSLRQASIEGG